eukprot:TRINITY_DN3257_c0_g1_i1.p1 TRINITY_DN3257_c0_g1~~TRINITY_DN3257_c0_g1_i1.p1  ORF type:complete len:303 (+),score=67.25 TRINITY_DN3257_c0_g1_i1:262-1170(+)
MELTSKSDETAETSDVERELGKRLEGLWIENSKHDTSSTDVERLNSCLDKIPVLAFPPLPTKKVIEINSDASLPEAIEVLAKNRILSAPVRDVAAPEDASWMDKYIGFAEFSGIVMWLLHQSESTAYGTMADSMTTLISYGSLGRQGSGILAEKTANPRNVEEPVGAPDPEKLDSGSALGGDFFEMLTSSEFYRETKVKDIAGSFRWAPFLALQKSDSFLTMLLLLSKYRIKCLPVVDIGGERIENIITQSSVVHMLAKCIGLPWFKNWGEKSLFDVDLPAMKPEEMVKVCDCKRLLDCCTL